MLDIWHARYAHLGITGLVMIIKKKMVTGMDDLNISESSKHFCEPCIYGKMTRTSFPKQSLSKTHHVLELVHSDVCGPIEVETKQKNVYFVTFIADFSRYTVIFLIRKKSDVFNKFKEYLAMSELHTGVEGCDINSHTLV